MKISIIIPCFNQAEYLEDAIESAYNQSYPPHEIIVVDDGSTDGSGEIAERYMFKQFPLLDSPVKVIHQVNKGLASARNAGIAMATGDFILPLDADDMLMENAVEVITRKILEYSKVDVIAPSFQEFGKSDRKVILQDFTLEHLKQANRLGYFSAIRRSALLECGGYNPKMIFGWEDYDLWFDLWKRGKSFLILNGEEFVLVKYRVKEHSMITEANKHADELWRQIRINHPEIFSGSVANLSLF